MNKNSKRTLYLISSAGELFLALVAIIILAIKKQSFVSIVNLNQTPNALLFIILILCASAIAIFLELLVINFAFFSEIKKLIDEIINNFNLNAIDALLIPVIAGICEEILFRGVLQPMLGIWLTSFIFIFLHGYFNPTSWRMCVFGVFMYGLSLILGLVYIKYGLITVMIFHIVYDTTIFLSFNKLSEITNKTISHA
jgi:membrane protease YdiL (CAAX protease family)